MSEIRITDLNEQSMISHKEDMMCTHDISITRIVTTAKCSRLRWATQVAGTEVTIFW